LKIKNKPSFLVVCFRYLGDVVVTTPLALSLKTAYPDASIDYLVFEGTDKIIVKNPLISKIITVPRNKNNLGTLFSLFRKYDIAFAACPSDRTIIAASMAGRKSIGLAYKGHKELLRKIALNEVHYIDVNNHIVSAINGLSEKAGIPAIPSVTMGYDGSDSAHARKALPIGRSVLMHPYSLKRCKYWPAKQWGELAALILKHTDCKPVFTATPSREDNIFLDTIMDFAPEGTMKYPCNLNQFAAALQICAAYVGVDTATTHISAAMQTPTVALYGPTPAIYWAPWPNSCKDPSPFRANKGIQKYGNVTIVQKGWECVPCNKESCAISKRDKIECLEQLAPEEVFKELMKSINTNQY
jgi:heptosyltransferase III